MALGLTMTMAGAIWAQPEPVLDLPPRKGNPRNSEGDFIQLRDGRILFVYTHFTGGGADNAAAFLAGRISKDRGETWTRDDRMVLENEGKENIMSVSLERLPDGRIAMLYLRKNSWTDCRPFLRYSADETESWSPPVPVIADSEPGYYVVNNDRLVQLSSGRLIVPAAKHNDPVQNKFDPHAEIWCYLSDDNGSTWHRSRHGRDGSGTMLQEPGVVELKDGRLMMFCRTDAGSQFVSFSEDQGSTWSEFQAANIPSPRSPATIERIPSTGDLLLVWNDHSNIDPRLRGKRTPLTVAVSDDEGETWSKRRILYDNPNGWYCYTAMEFLRDGSLLLGHCAGDRTKNNGLAHSRITRVSVSWIYDH